MHGKPRGHAKGREQRQIKSVKHMYNFAVVRVLLRVRGRGKERSMDETQPHSSAGPVGSDFLQTRVTRQDISELLLSGIVRVGRVRRSQAKFYLR